MTNTKFDQITYAVLNINRSLKRLIVICVDISLCALTVWLSFYLRLGEFVPFSSFVMGPVIASTLFAIPIFITAGLYRAIFRYSRLPAINALARAMLLYGFFCFTIYLLWLPRRTQNNWIDSAFTSFNFCRRFKGCCAYLVGWLVFKSNQ